MSSAPTSNHPPMDIGLIGLGVMGCNLALNLVEKGWGVAGFDIHTEFSTTCRQQAIHYPGQWLPCTDLHQLTTHLKSPRHLLLMIPAGEPVDRMIAQLLPILSQGDVVMDCGNSHFADTTRRHRELALHGIHYFGTGISGGATGARHGPAIMVGGGPVPDSLWRILETIAARHQAEPCLHHAGPNGAGHFVKMVHNGIEYADMQLLAECQSLMQSLLGLEYPDQAALFETWNQGELSSYLTGITAKIIRNVDRETGKPALEMIADIANHKGTGQWAAELALNLGVSTPNLIQAVDARFLSSFQEARSTLNQRWPTHPETIAREDRDPLITALSEALLAARISVFAQGFHLMRLAGQRYEWPLDLAAISRCWRGGCILQGVLLESIRDSYTRDPDLDHFFLDDILGRRVAAGFHQGRSILTRAVSQGIPIPGLLTALSYWDAWRHKPLWTRMVAAQRDYFGAHGVVRADNNQHVTWDWS
ncbi:MAG: NADP-dependent phosphogluconate dehydrogenase [Magnetococcales bacterium]|nr:NADP-dependent phosphogluconate dehydrogenase [Magnetococcales bacterium]